MCVFFLNLGCGCLCALFYYIEMLYYCVYCELLSINIFFHTQLQTTFRRSLVDHALDSGYTGEEGLGEICYHRAKQTYFFPFITLEKMTSAAFDFSRLR